MSHPLLWSLVSVFIDVFWEEATDILHSRVAVGTRDGRPELVDQVRLPHPRAFVERLSHWNRHLATSSMRREFRLAVPDDHLIHSIQNGTRAIGIRP